MFSADPTRFKYRQNACCRDIVLKRFAFLNLFKHSQNVCFRDIVFQKVYAVPNRLKYRQNAYFKDIAPGSITPRTSHLIIWLVCFVVRSLFQTSQNMVTTALIVLIFRKKPTHDWIKTMLLILNMVLCSHMAPEML